MKKTLLLSFVLCFGTYCFSQVTESIQQEDKTPRFLIQQNAILGAITLPNLNNPQFWTMPNEWHNEIYLDDTYIDFGQYYIDDLYYQPTVFLWTALNTCGENYHDNGILSSRCECNADSVLHGKSVYWDDRGRISSVYHYFDGKMYSQKSYSEGKINSLSNYTYKDGTQQLHGKQISYSDYGKTISNYRFGQRYGVETEYTNGYKYRETKYNNNIVQEVTKWDEEGMVIAEEFYDEAGKSSGEWLEYDPYNKTLTKKQHLHGKVSHQITTKNEMVIQEIWNREDGSILNERFAENGQIIQRYALDTDQIHSHASWRKDGSVEYEFQTFNNLIIGDGIWNENNIDVTFKQVSGSDGANYLECWKTTNGDTLSFYYAYNIGNYHRDVIYENQYTSLNGQAVKNGEWRIYENNKIVRSTHYRNGARHGKSVYYDTSRTEPIPYLTTHYHEGQKNGKWTLRNDSVLIEYDYYLGKLNGTHSSCFRSADTLQLSTIAAIPQESRQINETLTPIYHVSYKEGILHGSFKTYHENGKVRWRGGYYDGKRLGLWHETDTNDHRITEAVFEGDGSMRKKSYSFTYKTTRNGKVRQKKKRLKSFTWELPITPQTELMN